MTPYFAFAVTFTYNKRNQVATRAWARRLDPNNPGSPRVTTTYLYYDASGYDPDLQMQIHRTGELKKVEYNDGTAPVTYRFDGPLGVNWRIGTATKIFDATGDRQFGYRLHDVQPGFEWLNWEHYGNTVTTARGLWREYDALGRAEYVKIGWGDAPTEAHETKYTYDSSTGRLWRLRGGRPGVGSREFQYTYHPGSNQVDTITGVNNGFERHTQRQSWREVIEQVETKWWGASKARFTYNHDWAGQYVERTLAEGLAASLGYGSGLRDEYLYTARSEVDQAQARDLSTNNLVTNRQRDWTYDSQGNREYEVAGGVGTDYGVNNRNQYDRFNGNLLFTYDADGNMRGDPAWWYEYDGENRLKSATRKDQLQRLFFTYDYLSRRTQKVVQTGNGSGGYTTALDRRYLYDGWNLTVEIDALQLLNPAQPFSFKTEKAFTWGLDLTGTVHGGGGVGGLLMQLYPWADGIAYPLCDANGNIHGMFDEGGTVIAAWGYSAFGEVVQSTGWSSGGWSPFRFASKFYDEETQLYQYNHRYYSPKLGRFISRDPIAEHGGLNLYAYCGNDPVGHWDYLGQSWLSKAFKKIGRWVSNNWRSIVGVVLNFVPYVGQYLSMAWNAAVGYHYGGARGLALGFAGSYLGARVGGPLAGRIGNAMPLGGNFGATIARGYVQGGINGGITASLSGQNFWGGFRAGATTGAVLSGVDWTWENRTAIGRTFQTAWSSVRALPNVLASRLGFIPERQGFVEIPPMIFQGFVEDSYAGASTGSASRPVVDFWAGANAQQFLAAHVAGWNLQHRQSADSWDAISTAMGEYSGSLRLAAQTGTVVAYSATAAAVAPAAFASAVHLGVAGVGAAQTVAESASIRVGLYILASAGPSMQSGTLTVVRALHSATPAAYRAANAASIAAQEAAVASRVTAAATWICTTILDVERLLVGAIIFQQDRRFSQETLILNESRLVVSANAMGFKNERAVEVKDICPVVEQTHRRLWPLSVVPLCLGMASLGCAWWLLTQETYPQELSLIPGFAAVLSIWHTVLGLRPIEVSILRSKDGVILVHVYCPRNRAREYDAFLAALRSSIDRT